MYGSQKKVVCCTLSSNILRIQQTKNIKIFLGKTEELFHLVKEYGSQAGAFCPNKSG